MRTYVIGWSSLLLLAIYDLAAQYYSLVKKQSFLAEVIVMRILVFFELLTMVSRFKHPIKSIFTKILSLIYIALKVALVMVYLEDDTDQ
jgi:hypothetical protein